MQFIFFPFPFILACTSQQFQVDWPRKRNVMFNSLVFFKENKKAIAFEHRSIVLAFVTYAIVLNWINVLKWDFFLYYCKLLWSSLLSSPSGCNILLMTKTIKHRKKNLNMTQNRQEDLHLYESTELVVWIWLWLKANYRSNKLSLKA